MPYASIQVTGTKAYIAAVEKCLDKINTLPDGRILLGKLAAAGKLNTIKDTENGNACSGFVDETCPLLTIAIDHSNQRLFATALTAAIDNAKRRFMTVEHYARQLSIGLTPVSYKAKKNVVRKPETPYHMQGKKKAEDVAADVGTNIDILKGLMAGTHLLADIPLGWRFQLPRLLREHLTPNVGGPSTVYFNAVRPHYCKSDKAMHLRPPEIGLCHELIHALHHSLGTCMILVIDHSKWPNEENLEEVITTGLPPYHFEELSDNKMRTQWPDKQLELRHYR